MHFSVHFCSNCNKNCTGQATSYVCASNGVTYDNICEMEKAACLDHRELRAVEHAQCKSIALGVYRKQNTLIDLLYLA